MKTENERTAQEMFWRTTVKGCSTPEAALETLQNDAGLSVGRAILKMREYNPALYIAWRKAKPQFQPSKNPRMGHFTFRHC